MRNACLVWVVLIVCFASVSVHAQATEQLWDSGNAFLKWCHVADKSSEEMTKNSEICSVNHCISYVNGLGNGVGLQMDLSHASGQAELFPYCVSPGVTKGQPLRILLKYIRDNPAKAHMKTAVLFGMAMQEAFPCSGKKPQ
jgi:Rap1a immunity proteins